MKVLVKEKKKDTTEYVWCDKYDYWSAVRACKANCWRAKNCKSLKETEAKC
jgi:hypothetical protein